MADGLEIGFALDRRWRWLRGEMEDTKKPALLRLTHVLAGAGVPYRRLQDLADAHALLERDGALAATLGAEERALLERLPR